MSDPGNAAQVRTIADQVAITAADEAIRRFGAQLAAGQTAAPPKADLPAPLKWIGAIAAAIMTAGSVALFIWVVSTLNELQLTVARIDERQLHDTTGKRLDQIEERLGRLEQGKGPA